MVRLSTNAWQRRHLLGTEGLTKEELTTVLDTAEEFFPFAGGRRPAPPLLAERTVMNLFCENSTRTRTSFTLAAERLGARVIQFHAATSSLKKHETLRDTALTLDAMGLDAIVIRTSERNAPHDLAADERIGACVLNGGDDAHEHPTQALLDLLAMRHKLGRVEGLHVAIVGDVRHSRVARSNLHALTTLGGHVTFVGPEMFLEGVEGLGAPFDRSTDFDAVLPECDAVMMLRVQFERHERGLGLDLDEYTERYQLTAERLGRAREGAVVLHPGPINRGIELTDEVADGPASAILHQVTCGVAVRMAALSLCIGVLDQERSAESEEEAE